MLFKIPFGKYKGRDYFEMIANNEDIEYFHWLRAQTWFEERDSDFFRVVKKNLPDMEIEELVTRELCEEERAKNQEFNKFNIKNILKLSVTRDWGHRILSIKDWRWLRLRQAVINRDDERCRFCKNKFSKYLYVDHLNGDASNNTLNNLGVNCKGCDSFRHSGLAGIKGNLILRHSSMKQVDIVRKSYQYVLNYKKNPLPEEIDIDCTRIENFEFKDTSGNVLDIINNPNKNEIDTVILANILLKYNYEELDNSIKTIKGFFTQTFDYSFLDYIT